MSTSPTTPSESSAAPTTSSLPNERKIISHSGLYYWWPVWVFGFIFTLWTYVDNYRMAIVHPSSIMTERDKEWTIKLKGDNNRLLSEAVRVKQETPNELIPGPRVSTRSWMGPMFFLIIILVILVTNVPLRGLWSLVAIISSIVVGLSLSLLDKWDMVLTALGNLHIYMNMAGYLTISLALFVAWLVAVFVFDRRTYIIFTPGQLKVCEEVGGREKVYDTTNMTLEKRRDDWFRHIFLGFGSGDLSVRTAGAEHHAIVMPNVLFIGYNIKTIEAMLRSRQTTTKL